MRQVLIFAAASMLLAAPAAAQSFDPERQLETFSKADLIATLGELGALASSIEGETNLRVEFANGMKANAVLQACDDAASETNCFGTSILANFSAPESADPTAILEAINTYNYRENFGRAYIDEEGNISVRMYIISDGGITMESYRRQIQLWAASAEDFFGYLYGDD